jgi:hypothetical protein
MPLKSAGVGLKVSTVFAAPLAAGCRHNVVVLTFLWISCCFGVEVDFP